MRTKRKFTKYRDAFNEASLQTHRAQGVLRLWRDSLSTMRDGSVELDVDDLRSTLIVVVTLLESVNDALTDMWDLQKAEWKKPLADKTADGCTVHTLHPV